jgi:mono/diheme cytochrome c family protein
VKQARALPIIAALGLAALGLTPLQAQPNTSSGVYTADQAAAGARLYAANCSGCHGANLRGVSAPALIGNAFTSQWTDEPASDVYMMMSSNMPPSAPGSLTRADYLAIMAYILQQNKYPPGRTPLTEARLKLIKIVSPASS